MGRTQRSDRGKMMEKLTLSQRREERSAAKPQPKRIRDGGSKRRSCSLGNVRSEEKRQRTAALQNLAEASCCVARASVLECGCPLPLSLEPLSADRTLQSHPACTVELRFETFGNFAAACEQCRLLQRGGTQRRQNR